MTIIAPKLLLIILFKHNETNLLFKNEMHQQSNEMNCLEEGSEKLKRQGG